MFGERLRMRDKNFDQNLFKKHKKGYYTTYNFKIWQGERVPEPPRPFFLSLLQIYSVGETYAYERCRNLVPPLKKL